MKPPAAAAPVRHFLQFKDFGADDCAYLFERTAIIKRRFKNYEKYTPLVDRTLAMIFEKASTRTRVSFEAGMYQLGGSVVNLTTSDSQLGRAAEAGLLLSVTADRVIRLVPPLILSRDEAARMVDILAPLVKAFLAETPAPAVPAAAAPKSPQQQPE